MFFFSIFYNIICKKPKVGMFRNLNLSMCYLEFRCMITIFVLLLQHDRKLVYKLLFFRLKNIGRVRIQILIKYLIWEINFVAVYPMLEVEFVNVRN